jgi:hypothetical protein
MMRYFKDQADGFYVVQDDDSTVPDGWTQITEAEAAASMPAQHAQAFICSPWQIRKALNNLGLRTAVESAVAASDDMALKDGWEYATEFRSDDPFVLAMGQALGKTADETRDLIAFAATL